MFYGNNVPGSLVVLNKRKAPERKGKILLIWASRHYEANNPQNLLRRADCMRILVPWRAFGDLEKCRELVPQLEAELIGEVEHDRNATLSDIDAAYGPFLAPLPALREELATRQRYAEKEPPKDKVEAKKFREEKKANAERLKDLKRELKGAEKLEAEASEKRATANQEAERQIKLLRETAEDLLHICGNPTEAQRYFAFADRQEIQENEFNLNLPRYVETFDAEEQIPLETAICSFQDSENNFQRKRQRLLELLEEHVR